MKGMTSVFAEFDNNNRHERCKSGMQTHVREDIYCWVALLGYYIQYLIFAKLLIFDGDSFGTPRITLVFAQKKISHQEKSCLVARRGIEPLFSP